MTTSPIKQLTTRLIATVTLLLASQKPVSGATHLVLVGDYFFNPTNLTITVGDSVTWSNRVATTHDTTSDLPTNLWASPNLTPINRTFTFKFTNAGFYPYICEQHINAHPEQTGTVSVVSAANVAPTVLITNPPNAAAFTAPANVTIQASASDSDGSVTNVQFLVGSTVLVNDVTAPYSATTNGLPAGNYTLSAIASDNQGAKATNSISISVSASVNSPPTVAITNPPSATVFTAPANVTIEASASDSDGSVTNVQFLIGSIVLANDTTSPYSAVTNGLPAGAYTLSAIASDNLGAMATNTISISVTKPPPAQVAILNPTFNGSTFSISFATQVGYNYTAQFTASLNPINWLTLTNLAGNGSVVQVTDTTPTNSSRYYRVGAQ